jgi:hypothetical protein
MISEPEAATAREAHKQEMRVSDKCVSDKGKKAISDKCVSDKSKRDYKDL